MNFVFANRFSTHKHVLRTNMNAQTHFETFLSVIFTSFSSLTDFTADNARNLQKLHLRRRKKCLEAEIFPDVLVDIWLPNEHHSTYNAYVAKSHKTAIITKMDLAVWTTKKNNFGLKSL